MIVTFVYVQGCSVRIASRTDGKSLCFQTITSCRPTTVVMGSENGNPTTVTKNEVIGSDGDVNSRLWIG